jgi:hypothetical protein
MNMNQSNNMEQVVKTGTFVYAVGVECDVRIVHRFVRFGTGDQDDPPDIADDIVVDSYYVQYGSTTQRGVFNSESAAFESLQEAMFGAIQQLGQERTVRWHEVTTSAA